MLLRGFAVSHQSIRRWEAKLLRVMGEALRKRRHGIGRSSGQSWYTEENLPQGAWPLVLLLHRAIDRNGSLINSMLSATRDMKAAPEVLPLGTVGCWLCAGPGDNRRA